MSRVRLYLYSNCSSCKNAERLLAVHNVDVESRDLFRERLTAAELRALFAEIARSPAEMLSRRSIPYRQLELANANPGDDEILYLMAEYPALIRRPIVVAADGAQVGYTRSVLENFARAHERE
jgi:Spx/MgsR family transcriptional regulator